MTSNASNVTASAAAAPLNFCNACGHSIDAAAACPHCGAPQTGHTSTPLITAQSQPDPAPGAKTEKTKLAAALLALFLGGIGIHKFYMGSWGWGMVYLATFWTWVPALLALAEAIRYFSLSEEDFQVKAAQLNGPFSFLW